MPERPNNPYLVFEEHGPGEGRKTKIVSVLTASYPQKTLGMIKWYGAWRQYTFWPTSDTIFNKDCMQTIIEYIEFLMEERRA